MSIGTICDMCHSIIDGDEVTRLYVYNARQLAQPYFLYGPHERKYDLCRKCWKDVSITLERHKAWPTS